MTPVYNLVIVATGADNSEDEVKVTLGGFTEPPDDDLVAIALERTRDLFAWAFGTDPVTMTSIEEAPEEVGQDG